MTTKHTPGPWVWAGNCPEYSGDIAHILAGTDDNATVIAETVLLAHPNEDDGLDFATSEANGRLLAAAPELLEALEFFLRADDVISRNVGRKSDQAMMRIAAIDQAKRAIAKAKEDTTA
jgi:hypothetical protein